MITFGIAKSFDWDLTVVYLSAQPTGNICLRREQRFLCQSASQSTGRIKYRGLSILQTHLMIFRHDLRFLCLYENHSYHSNNPNSQHLSLHFRTVKYCYMELKTLTFEELYCTYFADMLCLSIMEISIFLLKCFPKIYRSTRYFTWNIRYTEVPVSYNLFRKII